MSIHDVPPPFTWNDIFLSWRFDQTARGPTLERSVEFVEILVQSPEGGLRIGQDVIDWWPTAELANRRTALIQNGWYGAYWNTPKGTLHTAELLRGCSANPEAEAAVFIAASSWDKEKNLPEPWRGSCFRLLQQIQLVTLYAEDSPFKRHALPLWHHAMRAALPVNIVSYGLAECLKPKTYADFVKVALIEAVLSTATWTPVVVSHHEHGLRSL